MRVLLVEDSYEGRLFLESRLKTIDSDLHLLTCESLEDANGLLERNQFDLIFLDLILKDTPGFSLEQAYLFIRKHHKTPLVVITAHEDDEIVFHCLSEGAMDFVSKQYFDKQLLKRLWMYANDRKIIVGQR